jgi:hypothetical protein
MKYSLMVALFIALMLTGAFKVKQIKADVVNFSHLIEGN